MQNALDMETVHFLAGLHGEGGADTVTAAVAAAAAAFHPDDGSYLQLYLTVVQYIS